MDYQVSLEGFVYAEGGVVLACGEKKRGGKKCDLLQMFVNVERASCSVMRCRDDEKTGHVVGSGYSVCGVRELSEEMRSRRGCM
ncbi:hypothetical protein HNY73_011707, partial [Argiope bruennichi]